MLSRQGYFRGKTHGMWVHSVLVGILVGFVMTTIQGPKLLHAQTSFGTILGSVADSSEAAIPKVTITVTNVQTGVARQTTTNEDGQYRIESLIPGVYSVKAEQTGFKIAEVKSVELSIATTLTVNIVMQVGAITQTIEVAAVAPLLDTTTGTIGTVVDNKSVVTLPLNGRSYTSLILLIPGSVPHAPTFTAAGGTNPSVSGTHPDQNSWTLDGVENDEKMFKVFGLQPSIDAIQEFRIQTNVTSAEYAQGAGANVSVALKSGTNRLHGSAFEFLRNDKLDAIDWFRNYNSTPDNPATRAPYKRNQYGGVIGGPVYIPHVYDGRNKLFFLFNYEGLKIRQASSIQSNVPSIGELGGNLTDQPPIYDPSTTIQTGVDQSGNPIFTRQQISCAGVLNVICPNRIDPTTAAYAALFYSKVTASVASLGGKPNYFNPNPLQQNTWQINNRADYKIKDNLSFFARYSRNDIDEAAPTAVPLVGTDTIEKYQNAVASWTYVPTPTLVVDFKLGVNRTNIFQSNTDPGAVAFLAAHPLQGMPIHTADHPMLPVFDGAGAAISQSGTVEPNTDIQGILNISKVRGKHTFKTGFFINNVRNLSDNLNQDELNFTSLTTADPNNIGSTGSSLASFLLGVPYGGTRTVGNTGFYGRWGQYEFYVQDDMRLTKRLTLNLGLRYQWDQPPRDAHNHDSMFDRTSGHYLWTSLNPANGEPANARPSIADPDFHDFAPRVGLAYSLTPRTIIRSSYGIFYATNYLWEDQGIRGQWPYAITQQISNINNDTTPPAALVPAEIFFPASVAVVPGTPPSGTYSLGRLDRTSYSQQWSLGVQRQLAHDLMLEVNYIGTKGTKMPGFIITNIAPVGPNGPDHVAPFPQAGLQIESDNYENSIYHGLQAKLEKKFSNGLQFMVSYAWANYIDIGGGGNTSNYISPNPSCFQCDRGPGAFDFRHILSVSYVYQLPFGRGRRYLPNLNSVANQALGGWEMTGITRYNSGFPYSVGINYNAANNGWGGDQRPDRIANLAPPLDPNDKTQGWINPANFANPAQYTYGNLGRNTERGAGMGNWDFGLFKNLPLHGENEVLQFRSEFYNFFNNVSLGGPNATYCQPLPACNPGFGRITGAQNTPREIQFSLKFLF